MAKLQRAVSIGFSHSGIGSKLKLFLKRLLRRSVTDVSTMSNNEILTDVTSAFGKQKLFNKYNGLIIGCFIDSGNIFL